MENKIKYSIITPVYNRADCIMRCMVSVSKSMQFLNGGGCPRTTDHKSEILQSVSSSDDSCLSYGNNYQLLGGNTSNPSSATYNLKVENSQN